MTPRATEQRKPAPQRKRNGKAPKPPMVIDVNAATCDLRDQLTHAKVLSGVDSAAVLRWIETGKGRPRCV